MSTKEDDTFASLLKGRKRFRQRAPKRKPKGRLCRDRACEVKLSVYNLEIYCYVHRGEIEALELRRKQRKYYGQG